ncbi:MAG: caspase family protein, partial [bacterium]|nr:caspase family protein [bacterium]
MDQTGVPRPIARRECPLLLLVALLVVMPAAAATRRALLIGIDDYTSAAETGGIAVAGAEREYTDLDGAVVDAKGLRDMLIGRFGFDEGEVQLLTNGEATRDGILAAIRTHLVEPAQKDDEVVFFFAGHGSQVINSLSDEPDKLDETLVPADAARGVRDIRDKELRRYFDRILDRGARLTVVFDSCHSGSGWKGLPVGGKVRAVAPDLRDVADGCVAGRRPEDRGALLLAAAQDFQRASESCDENGQVHGAFSLALLRALRTAGVEESAERVFLRARALMRVGDVLQDPVLAGDATRRAEPPFGGRRDHVDGATVVAVGKVEPGGKLILQGGWVHGLSVDSELRQLPSAGSRDGWRHLRARVTKGAELMRSEARILEVDPAEIVGRVKVGDLFALDRWVVPVEVSLELWIPEADLDAK